jgi:hypothetical protein
MNKLAILLLNLILFSSAFAGEITQQRDISTFTDQDLEKYKKGSGPDSSIRRLDRDKNEAIEKDSSKETGAQGRAVIKAKDEISKSEKKSIEREFNTIVSSMISQLKAGNIEGALSFFVESRKDKHKQIFKALKDNNTLKAAFEGYMGVEIEWISNHVSECGFSRKENGKIYSYPIKFMEVAKGVWKIYDF